MKILVVRSVNGIDDNRFSAFLAYLKQENISVVIWQEKRGITNKEVNEMGIDLVITFDLCGFNHSTLTDGIAYNLLDCKQIHFLKNRNLSNEMYLSKPLSISMFFFCFDFEYYNYLIKKCPDIPFLEVINMVAEEDELESYAKSLYAVIEKVADACGMIIR